MIAMSGLSPARIPLILSVSLQVAVTFCQSLMEPLYLQINYMTMENKNQLTAVNVMQRCKSIILTDDQGQKHGMVIWATFNGNLVSETEYHKLLDGLFDLVKVRILDTDISVNYRFCNNRIIVMGGESRWMEELGTQFEINDRWLEFLIDMELADLPVTSNFAEFMQKLDELEESGEGVDYLYPINMTLFKKPVDTGRLGEVMESLRGAMTATDNWTMELTDKDKERLQEEIKRLKEAPDKPCQWLRQRLDYACAWSVGFISGVLAAINKKD